MKYNLNEPDWNRLSRSQNIEQTIVSIKQDNRQEGIPICFDIDSWNEPNPYYNAVYPENKVFSTHNGLIFEMDDTEENRRIHIYHPSHTYLEISEEGNVVFRNAKNKYEIIDNSLFKFVVLDYYKTIVGDNATLIGGEDLREVEGNQKEKIHLNESKENLQNRYHKVQDNDHLIVNSSKYCSVSGNSNVKSSNHNVDSGMIYLNSGKAADAKFVDDNRLQQIREKFGAGKWWQDI